MSSFYISSDGEEQKKNLNCMCNTPAIRAITGKIINQCGEPIPNATIKSVTACLEPVAHTTSNEDGEYTLTVPKFIGIKLIVSKDDFITICTGVIVSDTQNFTMVCQEQSTCIIKGRALFNACKSPCALRIRIKSKDYEKTCFTNSNGTFIFLKVPPGKYVLTIDGNECYKKVIGFIIEQGKEYCQLPDIFVNWKNIGGTLHGIITDSNGKPIANSLVILYNKDSDLIINHTMSNDEGIYFFGNLPLGSYYVEAYCP